jgi:hypothetical protein
MRFIHLIASYFWNLLKSLAAIPWTILVSLFPRIIKLTYHLLSGTLGFFHELFGGIKLLFTSPGGFLPWLGKRMLMLLAWLGRIITKALDIVLLGELLDFVFQLVKPNQRTLTKEEVEEAKKVYGDALPYWQIRIDEWSLIARLGAIFAGSFDMGVTTFHTINFTRKIDTSAGSYDMVWLIHELAHVSQMENFGIQYIFEALIAQNTGGYHYGGTQALPGKKLSDFNREQQAEIAADYYNLVLYGKVDAKYFLHLIEEFRDTRILKI